MPGTVRITATGPFKIHTHTWGAEKKGDPPIWVANGPPREVTGEELKHILAAGEMITLWREPAAS